MPIAGPSLDRAFAMDILLRRGLQGKPDGIADYSARSVSM